MQKLPTILTDSHYDNYLAKGVKHVTKKDVETTDMVTQQDAYVHDLDEFGCANTPVSERVWQEFNSDLIFSVSEMPNSHGSGTGDFSNMPTKPSQVAHRASWQHDIAFAANAREHPDIGGFRRWSMPEMSNTHAFTRDFPQLDTRAFRHSTMPVTLSEQAWQEYNSDLLFSVSEMPNSHGSGTGDFTSIPMPTEPSRAWQEFNSDLLFCASEMPNSHGSGTGDFSSIDVGAFRSSTMLEMSNSHGFAGDFGSGYVNMPVSERAWQEYNSDILFGVSEMPNSHGSGTGDFSSIPTPSQRAMTTSPA